MPTKSSFVYDHMKLHSANRTPYSVNFKHCSSSFLYMAAIPIKPSGCSRIAPTSIISSSRLANQLESQTSPFGGKVRNIISSMMRIRPQSQADCAPESVAGRDRVTTGNVDAYLAPRNDQRSVIYAKYTCVNKM